MLAHDLVMGEARLSVLGDYVHVRQQALKQVAIENDGRAAQLVEALDDFG